MNKLQVCFIHHLKVLKKTLWCCIFRYRRGRAALFANYFRNDGTHKHKTSFCSVWMQILCSVVNSALDKTPWHCGVVSVFPANNTQYQRLIQTKRLLHATAVLKTKHVQSEFSQHIGIHYCCFLSQSQLYYGWMCRYDWALHCWNEGKVWQ